jgi:hypothetical protein
MGVFMFGAKLMKLSIGHCNLLRAIHEYTCNGREMLELVARSFEADDYRRLTKLEDIGHVELYDHKLLIGSMPVKAVRLTESGKNLLKTLVN